LALSKILLKTVKTHCTSDKSINVGINKFYVNIGNTFLLQQGYEKNIKGLKPIREFFLLASIKTSILWIWTLKFNFFIPSEKIYLPILKSKKVKT